MATAGSIRKMIGPLKKRLRDNIKKLENTDPSEYFKLKIMIKKGVESLENCKEKFMDLEEIDATIVTDSEEIEILVCEAEAALVEFEARVSSKFEVKDDPLKQMATAISALTAQVSALAQQKIVTPSPSTSNNEANNSSTSTYRLPELKLPLFYGDVLKWTEFWESYSVAVHQKNWPKIEKFSFLRSVLKGKAKLVIEGLPLSENNYDIAIERLQAKYSNKQVIIIAHMNNIKNIPVSDLKTENIRNTFENIEKDLAALAALGENTDNMFLIPTLMSKFPFSIREKITEKCSTIEGGLTTPNFRSTLNSIVKNREMAEIGESMFSVSKENDSRAKSEEKSQESSFSKKKEYQKKEASMLTAEKITCIYCKEEHYSDECSKYDTVVKRAAVIKNRCNVCFSFKHETSKCKRQTRCAHCGKKGEHHRSLCPDRKATPTTSLIACGEETFMPTLLVKIGTLSKIMHARILLDTGSQRSYITLKLVNGLGLKKSGYENLSIARFGTKDNKSVQTSQHNITLFPPNDDKIELNVNAVPYIAGKLRSTKAKFPNLKLAQDNDSLEIDVLIGSDYFWKIVKKAEEIKKDVFMITTCFGNILGGSVHFSREDKAVKEEPSFYTNCLTVLEASVQNDISKIYDLENIGIHESPSTNDNDVALEKFYKSVIYKDKRYSVGWPWISLPENSNYKLAFGRFRHLIKKYKNQPNVIKSYQKIIDGYLENDIIEKVPPDEKTDNTLYYIPHQPVIKVGKELRIVLDASARSSKKAKSLNEHLFRGPMLFENLCALLITFRLYKYGIIADIEKAFLQLKLLERDRDVTRIFWLKDCENTTVDDGNVEIYRYKRVPFGYVSSPFLLNAVLIHHCKKAEPEWKEKLKFYVDNLVCGANSDEEVKKFYNYAKNFMQEASMNLRQWASNSVSLDQIEDRETDEKLKILGLIWDTKKDILRLKNNLKEEKHFPCTKKNVLSAQASLFDPVGFFHPWSLRSKLFLRKIIEEGHPWHKELIDRNEEWKEIFEQLHLLTTIEFPRCQYYGTVLASELHTFTDASSDVYGACIYLRQIYEGNIQVDLLFSKQRLRSLKQKISIPRMELLGLLLGVRSLKFLKSFLPLKITKTYVWSDSKCALSWIESDKILPVFVQKVVNEIRLCEVTSFSYVNTLNNPADLLTRPQSNETILTCDLWWKGPMYLRERMEDWKNENVPLEEDNVFELPEESILTVHESVTVETPFGIRLEKYSSLKKLINITKICLRFTRQVDDPLFLWLSYMQRKHFTQEIHCMKKNYPSMLVKRLDLWLDKKGLIRCGGRLKNITSSGYEAFPILLSQKSPFVKLLIAHYHVSLMHVGVGHTLAELRRIYWLIQGRRTIQNVLKSCLHCRRFMTGPFIQPKMPEIPIERVQDILPFANVGVDIFGPYCIENQKVYGCIFTCMTCRAVHLELSYNLTAQEISFCIRKFIARRGTPDLIVSDNGSQLKTIVNHLEKVPDMEWKFIKELSPWAGGFYERLIAIVKQCLSKTTLHLSLNRREFEVVLIEAEYVLNSRPLTYVGGDDVNEFILSSVLTPAKFLNLRSKNHDGLRLKEEAMTNAGQQILQSWKKISAAKEFFEMCWRKFYLPSLRERYSYTHTQGRNVVRREPQVGELVLIDNPLVPRSKWRIGRVIELLKSKDDNIRSVRVKTKKSILNRPVNLLYPVEI